MPSPIKILFTGDLCPHNRIEKLALENNFAAIFNDFIDVFKGNDLNVTDLECPLTESIARRLKTGPHQKAHPKCIEMLSYSNIGLVAIANNHIMDFGAEGVMNTIRLCRESGIATVGVGENTNDVVLPFSTIINGKKIAVLNVCDNEFVTVPNSLFQANPIEEVRNYYEIVKARAQNDYVIIIVHGGNEFFNLPSLRIKKLYRFFIDVGADAVISHHTHEFSGYEIYNDKPIFYGLGNFIYDWPGRVGKSWNNGYIIRLKITDKISFDIIPLKQCNEIPGVFHLDKIEEKAFYAELQSLNSVIADDQKLSQEFEKYCDSVYQLYDTFIEPYFGKVLTILRQRGLFPRLMSRRKRLLLLNIIRCESHREVLLRMLKKYE